MDWQNNKIYRFYKLFRRGFRGFRWPILALTILGVLGGLLEGVGINAAIPMFSFLMGSSDFGSDFISRAIQQFFSFTHLRFNFRYLLIFICSLFILRAIALFTCNYLRVKIAARYEEETRNRLFGKTLKADWPFLLQQKLGYLDTILAVNIQNSSLLLRYLSGVIMTIGGLSMYILVALSISFSITMITLALGALLVVVFYPLVYKTKVISQKKEAMNKVVAHHINENILGIKTIKAMRLGDAVAEKGKEYFKKLKDFTIRVSFLQILSDSLIQPIGLIFICTVFAVSYKLPGFNFVALAAVIYLIQRIFVYIQQLQSNLHTISESIPYLQGIIAYEDLAVQKEEMSGGLKFFNFQQSLEFKKVGFNYEGGGKILEELNLKIKKGEMIGLIGPSGAGKTTVVDLILRLFNPTGGEILLDGKDIAQIDLTSWRENIGYVAQDIYLKNDTIAANIKFYDETISDEQMIEAARMANSYEFINECPEKFKTMVGERGVQLSAGQRQRIIIARVLARRPQILILDEATSALDNESETQIQKVIENLKNKVTVLIIAHRLSTIINSDRLLVLDNGKIVEEGIPRALLENKESYFYRAYNIKNNN